MCVLLNCKMESQRISCTNQFRPRKLVRRSPSQADSPMREEVTPCKHVAIAPFPVHPFTSGLG